jgi:hypothetical protein
MNAQLAKQHTSAYVSIHRHTSSHTWRRSS